MTLTYAVFPKHLWGVMKELFSGVNCYKLTWPIWTLLSHLCFWIMICINAISLILHYVPVASVKMHIILFFICKKYTNACYKFMDRLLSLNDLVIIDTHLLWSDNVLSTELNNSIFSYVQTFIHETRKLNCCSYCTITHL